MILALIFTIFSRLKHKKDLTSINNTDIKNKGDYQMEKQDKPNKHETAHKIVFVLYTIVKTILSCFFGLVGICVLFLGACFMGIVKKK